MNPMENTVTLHVSYVGQLVPFMGQVEGDA